MQDSRPAAWLFTCVVASEQKQIHPIGIIFFASENPFDPPFTHMYDKLKLHTVEKNISKPMEKIQFGPKDAHTGTVFLENDNNQITWAREKLIHEKHEGKNLQTQSL